MRIDFTKMHGLGNDFVVLDTRNQPLPPVTTAPRVPPRCPRGVLLDARFSGHGVLFIVHRTLEKPDRNPHLEFCTGQRRVRVRFVRCVF